MNANNRKCRKLARALADSKSASTRIEDKLDMLLALAEDSEHKAARAGAVSGCIAGGITGGAVAFVVLYGKIVLAGV